MCYYSFLIKKATIQEVFDFTDFIGSRMEAPFLPERKAKALALRGKA